MFEQTPSILSYAIFDFSLTGCAWPLSFSKQFSQHRSKQTMSSPPSAAKRRLLQSLPHSQLSLLYNPPLILHQSACRQRFWSRLTTPIYKPGIGNKTCLCFLYLSPKSVLYCLSFCLAHCCICAQATTVNKTVLQLLLTKQIPTHAMVSNR